MTEKSQLFPGGRRCVTGFPIECLAWALVPPHPLISIFSSLFYYFFFICPFPPHRCDLRLSSRSSDCFHLFLFLRLSTQWVVQAEKVRRPSPVDNAIQSTKLFLRRQGQTFEGPQEGEEGA